MIPTGTTAGEHGTGAGEGRSFKRKRETTKDVKIVPGKEEKGHIITVENHNRKKWKQGRKDEET